VTTRKYEQRLRAEGAEETRRRILDALSERLCEAPSEPVNLEEVARMAGVVRPTIYAVFGSRAGLFSALGGLGLTMTTGIGSPRAGVLYTLSGLAAVVIGGVSLVGGRGGIVGPIIAAFVLTLIPADLIFLNIDPNFGQVIQGTLIVLVVMVGGFATLARSRK